MYPRMYPRTSSKSGGVLQMRNPHARLWQAPAHATTMQHVVVVGLRNPPRPQVHCAAAHILAFTAFRLRRRHTTLHIHIMYSTDNRAMLYPRHVRACVGQGSTTMSQWRRGG